MPEPVRVLLADSQGIFRTGLATSLKVYPDLDVSEANDSLEAVAKAQKLKPHVVLVDILMPQCDWRRMIASIKESAPKTRVLVLTNSDRDDNVFGALSSGADGYLLKSASETEIVQAVRRAVAGELVLAPAVSNRLIAALSDGVGVRRLSAREAEALQMLGDGMSNSEIADRLSVSESTVRTYIHRIKAKLNLNSRAEAVAYGARHYLDFSRIAEGFKALRIHAEPAQGQIVTTGQTDAHQELSPDALAEAASRAPGDAADVTTEARLAVEGERKQVTALFAEVGPFHCTSGVLTPEETDELVNECLELIREEVRRYDGTIAWFSGNGVMAFFGVPVSQEDSPQRALHAALAARERLHNHARRLGEQDIEFDAYMGINTGVVLIEKKEDGLTTEYRPVGNTSDLALRARGVAEPDTIVVTGNTHRLTEGYFDFIPLEGVESGGEEEAIRFYHLVGSALARSKLEAATLRGLTRFIGREREMSVLQDCVDKAGDGRGQVVGILGEAGVGKSRLLRELRNKLHDQDCTYLEGSCLHHGESIAYLPILNILRAYFEFTEGEQQASTKKKISDRIAQLGGSLESMLPPLQDFLSTDVDDEDYLKLEPPVRKWRIFDALRDLLIQLGRDRTLVVAIEDLQWIDKASEEFLTLMVDGLPNTRVMLILVYRPEYGHVWGGKSYYTQIGLDDLSSESASELIGAILDGAEVTPALSQFIVDKCGGNPFYLEEQVHNLLEAGLISRKDHQYTLSGKVPETQVPETVQAVIAARVDRLEASLKHALQVAAVIGIAFPLDVLQRVSEAGQAIDAVLQRLQGLGFVYQYTRFPEQEYSFKHALVREVAYSTLLTKSRRRIHERTGEAIEELHGENVEDYCEILAHHFRSSNDLEKAYHYLRLSAEKAARSYANWEALRFYKDAISVLNRLPDTEENRRREIDTRISMTNPMLALNYPDDSLDILEAGRVLSRELGDSRATAILCSSIGLCHTLKGDALRGVEHTEDALAAAYRVGDMRLIVPIAFDLSAAYTIYGEQVKQDELCSRVIPLIEQAEAQAESFGRGLNPYSVLLNQHGVAKAWWGYFEEGQALCERALGIGIELDDPVTVGIAQFMYGWVPVARGDGRKAIELSLDSIKNLERTQFVTLWAGAHCALGAGYWLVGELEPAGVLAERVFQIQRDMGIPYLLSRAHWLAYMVSFASGNLKNAREHAEEALRLAQEGHEMLHIGLAMMWLGRISGKLDKTQYRATEQHILRGMDYLYERKLNAWASEGRLFLGELYADAGDRTRALKALKQAESDYRAMGMDYWLRKTQEVLTKLEA